MRIGVFVKTWESPYPGVLGGKWNLQLIRCSDGHHWLAIHKIPGVWGQPTYEEIFIGCPEGEAVQRAKQGIDERLRAEFAHLEKLSQRRILHE